MVIDSRTAEHEGAVCIAKKMCIAARTAPKTRGIDNIVTLILTDDDIKKLSDRMIEVGGEGTSITRDGGNILQAEAVVMIGVKKRTYGLNCAYCGFADCAACEEKGGECIFAATDLGIAVGSAVSIAADNRVDNRVMYSAGRVYGMMNPDEDSIIWMGIPISATGKSPFFDRARKH